MVGREWVWGRMLGEEGYIVCLAHPKDDRLAPFATFIYQSRS
jgi:hypothetical protein